MHKCSANDRILFGKKRWVIHGKSFLNVTNTLGILKRRIKSNLLKHILVLTFILIKKFILVYITNEEAKPFKLTFSVVIPKLEKTCWNASVTGYA